MDAYSFYLSTFRYIMNADPNKKTTWCEIFKFLPCLRQMLSCCVCGSIMNRPKGPTHGVCLHHVCHTCVGGSMHLKPSCSWCKDHEHFEENKKLRVLILCFKKLCAYVTKSKLGVEISKASINGYGNEAERTMRVLIEAEHFKDDYVITPPPTELPVLPKSLIGGLKSYQPTPSTSAESHALNGTERFKRGRGRPKTKTHVPVKTVNSQNSIRERVKKLKKKALNSRGKNKSKMIHPKTINLMKTQSTTNGRHLNKKAAHDTTDLLISQRPHRDKSGKYSVGQLWRETFLEDVPVETYPDSGIEVGNSSDHDNNIHPLLTTLVVNKGSNLTNEKMEGYSHMEMRHHKSEDHDGKTELSQVSVNSVSSSTDEPRKPRLTLTISKKRLQKFAKKNYDNNFSPKIINNPSTSYESSMSLGPPVSRMKKSSLKLNKNQSRKIRLEICRCARFKQPNHLTCFGQKCPCYSDKRACVSCLCNGCKNPLRTPDAAPPLMHVLRDSDSLESSFDRSMPRLSPIPKI